MCQGQTSIAQACFWPDQSLKTRSPLIIQPGINLVWGEIVMSWYAFGAKDSFSFHFSLFNFFFLSALWAKPLSNKITQLYLWVQKSSFQKDILAIEFEGFLLFPHFHNIFSVTVVSSIFCICILWRFFCPLIWGVRTPSNFFSRK